MRLLVCGGRDFSCTRTVDAYLNTVLREKGIEVLIEGGARGADRLGREWAVRNGIPIETYYADWDKFRKSAGYIRNKRMLDEGRPDGVVAFPGGTGTANMILQSEQRGLVVWKAKLIV